MRFRLYPTPDQEPLLREHCTHARFVWNLGLEQRNLYRPALGPTPNFVAQAGQLTEARRSNPWLAAGSQTVQQQALRDLDRAFKSWWSNPSNYGRPTWRKAGTHEGFEIVGSQAPRWERLSRKRARVLIPKVGWVDWRWTRDPGTTKSYRVKRDAAGRWWISFPTIPAVRDAPGNGEIVGVDRWVAVPFALSTGDSVCVPGLTAVEAKRLLRLQRKMARQVKGSSRREATKVAIARIKAREKNRRVDTIEKLTTTLATEFDVIRIERLAVNRMTRAGRGKRGLNREILRSGWGLFSRRINDKAPGRVELIHAAFTSQRCFVCKHVAKESRKSQAVFECVACGHRDNADLNAAKNIAAGHAVTARGGPTLEPVNREPQFRLLSA